jgi:hypothetical protein
MTTLLDILQTRVEIVATEFEEERARLQELVVFGILTLFFVGVGLTLLTLFVVILYWDTHRLAVLGWPPCSTWGWADSPALFCTAGSNPDPGCLPRPCPSW